MIFNSGFFGSSNMYATIISNEISTNRRHRNMDEGAMYNNYYNYALR